MGFDQQKINQMQQGVGAAADAASKAGDKIKELGTKGPANGGFAVSEEAFNDFNAVCDKFLNGYFEKFQAQSRLLETSSQNGSSMYAKRVAEFNGKVFGGDHESFATNLEKMRVGFEKMQEGLKAARKHYNEADADNDTSMKSIVKDLD